MCSLLKVSGLSPCTVQFLERAHESWLSVLTIRLPSLLDTRPTGSESSGRLDTVPAVRGRRFIGHPRLSERLVDQRYDYRAQRHYGRR